MTPWLFTSEGLKLLGTNELLESPAIIIPRKYLLHFSVDLTAVPSGVRASFIAQKVKQSSPFQSAAHTFVIISGFAQVWVWDGLRAERFQNQQELANLPIVPETLFYVPLQEGYRVQPCFEGWELQQWSQGCLVQSRWFSGMPSEDDRADFVRAVAKHDHISADWYSGSRELLAKPFNERPFWSKENLLEESVLPKIILGLLLALFVWQLAQTLGVLARESYQSYFVTLQQKKLLERVRQRDQALDQQEFNQQMGAIVQAPSQLHLLAELQKCLDGQNYMILDWQYQRGQLSLLIQQDQPDARALVEICSQAPLFEKVHTEPGSATNQTRLLLNLKGVAEIGGGSNVQ